MAKYTDARYPEKINDLVDNDGNVNIPTTGWYKHYLIFSGADQNWDFVFISPCADDLSGTYDGMELDNLLNNIILIPAFGGLSATPIRNVPTAFELGQDGIFITTCVRGTAAETSLGTSVELKDTVEEL